MRDKVDLKPAEVAIAMSNARQDCGVGGTLIRALATSAWEAGIQSWSASFYTDNFVMRKLLELVGYEQSEKSEEIGTVSLVVYRLSPPSLASADG
jgi:L-amino acid N-acyltransferase YncA